MDATHDKLNQQKGQSKQTEITEYIGRKHELNILFVNTNGYVVFRDGKLVR
jgi:hypothetical protein